MRKRICNVIMGIVFVATAGFAFMTCKDNICFTVKKDK